MSKPNAAKEVAQGLVVAYRNTCEAEYIVTDKDELSKADVCLLRERLCGIERDLRLLIVVFVGSKLMEVE